MSVSSGYENMNYGLCRLLIPIISGAIAEEHDYTPSYLNDAFWDLNTINVYKSYMQAKVFTPSGVANADFEPLVTTPDALAYHFHSANHERLELRGSGYGGWRRRLAIVRERASERDESRAPQGNHCHCGEGTIHARQRFRHRPDHQHGGRKAL